MNKTFNVVCVTKRSGDNDSYHLPIVGPAELAFELEGARRLQSIFTVQFRGSKYAYIGARTGLDGSCLILIIKISRWETWELYTDTPSGERPEITPEKIREKATQEIANRKRWDKLL